MSQRQLPHEGQTALVHTLGLVPVLCFEDRVSLFVPGWPGVHCIDQAASAALLFLLPSAYIGYRASRPAFDQCAAGQKCLSLVLVLNVHTNMFKV